MSKTALMSVILLAGGIGSRMKTTTPKQFLPLNKKPLVFYSLEQFIQIPCIAEIIIVCSLEYQPLFNQFFNKTIKFAQPGIRRQDSVYNGLQLISPQTDFVCIHDAARPFINEKIILTVFNAAKDVGAATLGVPLKFTVKEADENSLVKRTLDRTNLHEIQTPQVIRTDLLREGFQKAKNKNLTVTDDVSLIEELLHPVKIVEGSNINLKITTPEDLIFAELLMDFLQNSNRKTN